VDYFITGGTGFIGRYLIERLLKRDGTVHVLVREGSRGRLEEMRSGWGDDGERVIPVVGDLSQPNLGLDAGQIAELKGKIDAFYHLAAIYDMEADEETIRAGNIEGTINAVDLANEIEAGCFNHVSSIAAAGLFKGTWREDFFDEAEDLDKHPYFRTKHESERIARERTTVPWRVFRPGVVVGDSETGQMDKIDGPYYFFKLIKRFRQLVPSWMPMIGIEGGRINIVPVDFVVAALDHLSHARGLDGKTFHLVDPEPMRVGDVLNTFAEAGHAPKMTLRVNAALFGFVPRGVRKGLMSLTPVRRVRHAVMKDLGLPDDMLRFVNYPTRFDCRETTAALKGTGIACPPLKSYAWRLWDYWERHLDPDLHIDRTLRGQVDGKVVLVTGGSSGIGLAAAIKIAEAGAVTIICGREASKLQEAESEIHAKAGPDARVVTYAVDLADFEDCDRMTRWISETHGGVDVLVNNAGRSIRRGIE